MDLLIDFTFEDKFGIPMLDILVDNTVLYSGNVQSTICCSINLTHGSHQLKIVHRDKKIDDYDSECDKHIYIKKIYFNGVDLDQTHYCPLTHRGRFYPEYNLSYIQTCQQENIELPKFYSPNHYLGHNGVWVLDFTEPVYNWIIDEQKPSGINLEDTIFSTGDDSLKEIKKFFNV